MRPAALIAVLLASCATPGSGAATLERFPRRVHAVEDFETDIERGWWLAGRIETENVPAGSRRACRGTNSKDFEN